MLITIPQLRGIIKEALLQENIWSQHRDLLDQHYETVGSGSVSYPYGRNRGDVRSTQVYVRKDGQPIPQGDVDVFNNLEIQQKKDPYAALSGVYTHTVTDDGMSVKVDYYRHTAD
tara:strand:+ start:3743 stop:4087 length:345 start_codon:yes stop_codon:yes gene_type:complete